MIKVWLPTLLFLLFVPFSAEIDLKVASYFYDGTFYQSAFTAWMYKYGEWIGFVATGIAFFFLLSRKWRKPALAFILTVIIGAGVIINWGFKEFWGRPRPKQIEQFGGSLTFRPIYKPNFDPDRSPQKSFPSGHAAMGFVYVSLCLSARRMKNKPLFLFGLFLTLFFGISLIFTRIAQGGHFLSDTLASALIIWLTAVGVDAALHRWNLWTVKGEI